MFHIKSITSNKEVIKGGDCIINLRKVSIIDVAYIVSDKHYSILFIIEDQKVQEIYDDEETLRNRLYEIFLASGMDSLSSDISSSSFRIHKHTNDCHDNKKDNSSTPTSALVN